MKQEITEVMKSSKSFFALKFIVSCLLRGLLLVIPFFYSYAVEEITGGNLNRAWMLVIFLLIFTVLYYISEMVNDYAYEKLYYKIYLGLAKMCLKFTEKNSIYSLSRIPLGEYHSIMTSDIDVAADCYASIPMAIARVIELIFIFYYFLSVNVVVFILALIISIIVLITLYFGNKKVNLINIQDKSSHDQRLGILQEYFLGMKEVKGFRLFSTINKRISKSYDNYLNWHTRFGFSKVVVKYGALAIVDISKIVFLFYGFYMATKGKMTLAVILLVYSYFEKLTSNFTGLLDFNNQWQNSSVAKKRLYKLKEFSHDDASKDNLNVMSRGVIDFNDVVYGNREDPILNHFDAHICSNSMTVITGATGAGKTGVIDLLLKLNHQHEGTIRIDKIDIDEYTDEIYFANVAAVRKNPSFFNMSIRDNLEILEPDFEKIVKVCQEIGVHDEIMQLSNGYDTVISENAANVTSDIKYLLSVARVILKSPKVLLFDETLNAFPKEVDLKLMDYFRKTKGRHSVVIISKEKHVIEDADQVIYMEKGKNIATGKHDVLMLKNDNYKKYFDEL